MNRKLTLLFITIILMAGCSDAKIIRTEPIELGRDQACAVCGMITVDFPGAKGQIHYGTGKVDPFCCTLDMFTFYLQPDRPRNIAAIYVNDMAKADWENPRGHWIDAKKAFYVYGGDVMGPMGEALVPFSDRENAEAYMKEHGGRIIGFDDVTMKMLKPAMPGMKM